MIRRLLFVTLALSGCASSPTAGYAGWFSLDMAGASAPATTPVGVAASPGRSPHAPPDAVPTPEAPGGGGSASSGGLSGTVVDAAGHPLAGASITGAEAAGLTSADGRFGLRGGGAPALTASLPGYVSQTLEAPYAFALAPAALPTGPAYDVTGVTAPILPGALVVFTDADGAEARGVVDASGAFSLHVTPRSNPPAPGLLVVASDLEVPGDDRLHMLQLATPQAGAIAVDPAAPTGLTIAVASAPGRLALQAPAMPQGLSDGFTELSFQSEAGARAVISWGSGPWPADLPAPVLPGLRTCLAVSARSADGSALSTTEHLVSAGEGPWAPTLLAPPTVTLSADGIASWEGEARRYALALYPASQSRPSWEGVTRGRSLALPTPLDATGHLDVQASATDDVLLPTRPIALAGDRRIALRRLNLGAIE